MNYCIFAVALHVGAWIEIIVSMMAAAFVYPVALHVGAWIEIT
ncbi:hypothetical protein [Paenibacillus peoriae]